MLLFPLPGKVMCWIFPLPRILMPYFTEKKPSSRLKVLAILALVGPTKSRRKGIIMKSVFIGPANSGSSNCSTWQIEPGFATYQPRAHLIRKKNMKIRKIEKEIGKMGKINRMSQDKLISQNPRLEYAKIIMSYPLIFGFLEEAQDHVTLRQVKRHFYVWVCTYLSWSQG